MEKVVQRPQYKHEKGFKEKGTEEKHKKRKKLKKYNSKKKEFYIIDHTIRA